MSESLLKKEFRARDLQRARNLISGNYGASTQNSVGYGKAFEEHKEGDVWEENGKTWTIEDGLRISVSKLQRARELAKLPLTCPKCGQPMNKRLDKKMYPIHHMCFDCVIKFEDDLKRAGLYKEYEEHMMRGNMEGFVQELKYRLQDLELNTEVKIVTGEGDTEDWGNISENSIKSLNNWIEAIQDKLS